MMTDLPVVELTGQYAVFVNVGEFWALLYDGPDKQAALNVYLRAERLNQGPLLCERKRVVVV